MLDHLSNTALQLMGQSCHVLEATGTCVSVSVSHQVTVRSDICPIARCDLQVLCVSSALEHLTAPCFEALTELGPDLLLCLAVNATVTAQLAQHGVSVSATNCATAH